MATITKVNISDNSSNVKVLTFLDANDIIRGIPSRMNSVDYDVEGGMIYIAPTATNSQIMRSYKIKVSDITHWNGVAFTHDGDWIMRQFTDFFFFSIGSGGGGGTTTVQAEQYPQRIQSERYYVQYKMNASDDKLIYKTTNKGVKELPLNTLWSNKETATPV